MCLPIGSMLLRSKILWMKHVVFWREPDGVIPRATGDWLTGRWDSRKVLRHCHNTWKTSTYARRCWSSRFWHSDWKSGLFPDFYRKYSKVRTFPGPGGQQLKIRTFPGNKDPWEPCQWHGALMFSLICALSKQLSKHSWGWWFETPSRPSWCHCNDLTGYHGSTCLIGMPYCWNETCDSGDKAIWHTTALYASYMKSLICQK